MMSKKIKPVLGLSDTSPIEDFSKSLRDLSLSVDADSNDENLESIMDKYGIPKTID